ncbi:MAG TPA: protein kinase [Candidatus Acidoferrales bacterium]|nr:protein kinase [Candidatus Acidoferrales bacterium]
MTPEQWREIKKLLAAALETPPQDRGAYLDRTCADPALRREVESLLLAHEQGDASFMKSLDPDASHSEVLSSGSRLGPYEIVARIGAGGMGEVYRARDTRLNRTVAIKILPPHLAGSPGSRDRFEREARTVAGLNHPHICTLYDVGHQGDTDYLVMEFLEGDTLASRLVKGPMPLPQTLQCAIEIADALEKAHRKGVTHRDLKPGNIMLTRSGAKLLDFGLAKLKQSAAPAGVSLSQLPTVQDPITAQGAIVGTLQYMAPEQLEGKETDARADIFAFGAVLYEMATGKKAFEGKSQASTIAKILETNPPPIRSLQPLTPAALDRIVTTCLAKDPENRLQSAQDAKLELAWIRDALADPAAPESAASVPAWRHALPWALFGAALLVLAAFAWIREAQLNRTVPLDSVRLQIPLSAKPPVRPIGLFALSPDGRQLAFEAVSSDGVPRIWIRPMDSLEMRPLAGTESLGTLLFWSPDSRFIGFEAGGELRKIDVSGGPPESLCALNLTGVGGSWNRDGTIIFGQFGGPIMQVSAGGGVATPVTVLDNAHGDVAHTDPSFLPDGRHFLYLRDTYTSGFTSVGSLDAKPEAQDPKRFTESLSSAVYAPSSSGAGLGHLLFVRAGTLMAQPFDPRRLSVSGDPVSIVPGPIGLFYDSGEFSVSPNGTLVYVAQGDIDSQLAWFDGQGKIVSTVGGLGPYTKLSLSPDGTKAFVTRQALPDQLNRLWLVDLSRGTSTRFELDPSTDNSSAAVWAPDGRNIIFSSAKAGRMGDLYKSPTSSGADPNLLLMSNEDKYPLSWSPDGRFLLYQNVGGKAKYDLWVLPVGSHQKPVPLLHAQYSALEGRFSPDGRWIAYTSDESDRREVYVRPFLLDASGLPISDAGNESLISSAGGYNPVWRPDGKELYYVDRDKKLMSVQVTPGPVFRFGVPKSLFQAPSDQFGVAPQLASSGVRFLFLVPQSQGEVPFTVILNWQAALEK